jgi:transcriptional regulator with XRE-family HTH domain
MPLDPSKLSSLRAKRGLTQQSLAVAAGIPRSYVANMERGTKVNPPVATVQRVAKALKTSVASLLAEEP